VVGLSGFTGFFATLSFGLGSFDTTAVFVSAVVVGLLSVFTVDHIVRQWRQA
jgi:hypothetical protein